MIKQVLVVRKDLKMRKGKIAAQCSHASMKVFFDRMTRGMSYPPCTNLINKDVITTYSFSVSNNQGYYFGGEVKDWIENEFTKICVCVNSEEELMDVYKKACVADLPVALITDLGKTEFHGVPTKTCLAIGPAKSEEIDKITGKLKLL